MQACFFPSHISAVVQTFASCCCDQLVPGAAIRILFGNVLLRNCCKCCASVRFFTPTALSTAVWTWCSLVFLVGFAGGCCPVWLRCCWVDGVACSLASCHHRNILNCKLLQAFSVAELIVSDQTLSRRIGALQVVKR